MSDVAHVRLIMLCGDENNMNPICDVKAIERDFRQRFEFIIQNLEKHCKGKDILDIGCGTGVFMREMKKYGYNVRGIDIEKKCDDAEVMDAECMTFPDKSFDGIIAMNVIEHLKNPYKFLNDIKRIIKPDGICIISTPNTTWLRGLFRRNHVYPEHKQYWNYGIFTRMLYAYGFEVIDKRWVGRIPLLSQCDTFILATNVSTEGMWSEKEVVEK